MALLLAGAEIILPGWWRMFAAAIGQYHQYTQNQSVIEVILNQLLGSAASGAVVHVSAQILSVIAVLACVPVLWNVRREPADAAGFGATCSSLGIYRGDLRFGVAMDRELVPQRHVYVESNVGPESMAVAFFCHFCPARARLRPDSAGCAKNATIGVTAFTSRLNGQSLCLLTERPPLC